MTDIRKEYKISEPQYTHYYEVLYKWRADQMHYEIWFPFHPKDPWGKDATVHHLYSSGKLCVDKGKEPRDFEFAEAIAFYFMEQFSRYIQSGVFEDEGGTVDTPD